MLMSWHEHEKRFLENVAHVLFNPNLSGLFTGPFRGLYWGTLGT